MFRFLFDIMRTWARIVWDVLWLVLDLAMRLLSTAAAVLLWPAKAVFQFFHGNFGPLFLLFCGALAVLVLVLAVWAVFSNARRKAK